MRRVIHATLVVLLVGSLATLFVASAMRVGARQIDFDAYGQTPIPGQGTVQLPAGEVIVSVHAAVDAASGEPTGPLRIPADLKMTVLPSDEVTVTKSVGKTFTEVGHRYRPVWRLTVPVASTYTVSSAGAVGPASLTFGDEGWRHEYVRWMFIDSLAVTVVTFALLYGFFWRRGRHSPG